MRCTIKSCIPSLPRDSGERFGTCNAAIRASSDIATPFFFSSIFLCFSKKSSMILSARNLCPVFLSSISASANEPTCQLAIHVVACAIIAVSINIISLLLVTKYDTHRSAIFFFNNAPYGP